MRQGETHTQVEKLEGREARSVDDASGGDLDHVGEA